MINSFRSVLALTLLSTSIITMHARAQTDSIPSEPFRLAIVGLVHGHAGGFLNDLSQRNDVVLAAVVEPDRALASSYMQRFNLPESLYYPTVEAMLDQVEVDAVAVFTTTFDHPAVVSACAPRGIAVMMEKPLAVSMDHARIIEDAARQHDIPVLVNYETTWHAANHDLFDRVLEEQSIGEIRKMIVRDGHQGPKEIGVGPEFLSWLTDPVLNGGGALTDFGCYGANLMTHLMRGERPLSVTAVTQQLKTDATYARVDDEATILVTYPKAIGIIQASWNWPFNRKDMDVYGVAGSLHQINSNDLTIRNNRGEESRLVAKPLEKPYGDPLSYLMAVVRGHIEPEGLSSLENNLVVTEILDAARRSAESGETVHLQTRN